MHARTMLNRYRIGRSAALSSSERRFFSLIRFERAARLPLRRAAHGPDVAQRRPREALDRRAVHNEKPECLPQFPSSDSAPSSTATSVTTGTRSPAARRNSNIRTLQRKLQKGGRQFGRHCAAPPSLAIDVPNAEAAVLTTPSQPFELYRIVNNVCQPEIFPISACGLCRLRRRGSSPKPAREALGRAWA